MWRASILGSILCALVAVSFIASAARAEEEDIAGRVAKLERALDNRGLLDLLRQLERLQQEVQSLRGELENQNYALKQLRKTHKAAYVELDRRLQALAGGQGVSQDSAALAPLPGTIPDGAPLPTLEATPGDAVAGTPAPQSTLQVEMQQGPALPPADSEGPEAVPSSDDPGDMTTAAVMPSVQDPASVATPGAYPPLSPQGPTVDDAASETAYRDAFSLLKAGEYDQSIAAFSNFLQQFPNSQYGDNAQYWLAEAYYVKREFEPAIAEYQRMLVNFPASKKLSHAMLKIGYCYYELGQRDQARAVLEELRQRYPESAAARLAEDRIAQIDATAGAR